jgi:hypothetical protein
MDLRHEAQGNKDAKGDPRDLSLRVVVKASERSWETLQHKMRLLNTRCETTSPDVRHNKSGISCLTFRAFSPGREALDGSRATALLIGSKMKSYSITTSHTSQRPGIAPWDRRRHIVHLLDRLFNLLHFSIAGCAHQLPYART